VTPDDSILTHKTLMYSYCDLYSNITVRSLRNLTWKGRSPWPGTSESVPGYFKGHRNLIAVQSHSPLPSIQTLEMWLLYHVVLYLHIQWKSSGSTIILSSFRKEYSTLDDTASQMLS